MSPAAVLLAALLLLAAEALVRVAIRLQPGAVATESVRLGATGLRSRRSRAIALESGLGRRRSTHVVARSPAR